ncbi:MAG TPA: hypothetical protein VFU71_22325 [Burkholderiaceae bacterium]|nr:hypothetical protein [Burkholderiaceae bacterium]
MTARFGRANPPARTRVDRVLSRSSSNVTTGSLMQPSFGAKVFGMPGDRHGTPQS